MNDKLGSRLSALAINRLWFWVCLVFALCLLDPLPIDPIPFFGVPGAAVSLILFWVSWHLHFNRHKRLRMSAITALAEEGNLTVNKVADTLKIKKEKAESLLEEMLEQDMLTRTGEKKKKTTTYSLRP